MKEKDITEELKEAKELLKNILAPLGDEDKKTMLKLLLDLTKKL